MGRHPPGDFVKPRPQAFPSAQRFGFASQDEKGRLEGIFGVVSIAQGREAGSINQRAVALQENRKGRFGGVIAADKRLAEQFIVGEPGELRRPDRAENMIANYEDSPECKGHWIKASVAQIG